MKLKKIHVIKSTYVYKAVDAIINKSWVAIMLIIFGWS